MSVAEREAFLAEVHVGVLSVEEPGRAPLSLPIWYAVDDGVIAIEMAGTSKKARLLRAAGRASMVAQTETAPYKYVSVEGPIEIVPIQRDPLEIPTRYLGGELAAWYVKENPHDESSIEVRLTPEHWNTMDFGKQLGL